MAVRITHRVNNSAIAQLGTSPALRRYLTAKGVQVQTASRRRLREAPRRIDTGTLLNSIQVTTGTAGGVIVVRIGTNVEYAVYIHEGTRYIQANPFLRDGLRRVFP